MKKQTGNHLRLGIFVTVTIILFIAGIYFVGQRQQLFASTFHISAVFKDINGLQVGDNARYSGINVGIVSSIQQISDTTVKVEMVINEHSRKYIKKNASAIIGSDGLMGSKLVSIIPGQPGQPELANNDVIGTSQSVSMDEILAKIKITADNAADITDGLSIIMNNIRRGRGTIGKLFMDTSFAQNIDKTIVNLKQGTGGLKQNMDAASHNFLLRGYFKKKEKKEEKKQEKAEREEGRK